MATNYDSDGNAFGSTESIELDEITKLNLKKGDVLLIKVPENLPRKIINYRCKMIKEQFNKIFEKKISIIFIDPGFDLSVIRLEEWFV
jgi:hypothetical protein